MTWINRGGMTMDDVESGLKTMADDAARAGNMHADLDEAGAHVVAAKASLLDRVVHAAQPGMRAIASRVQSGEFGARTGKREQLWHASLRGVFVSDEALPNFVRSGGTTSTALLLDEQGTFVELTYEGGHEPDGDVVHWTLAAVRYMTTRDVAASRWSIAAIADYVSDALASYANGKGTTRAASLRRTAKRIAAVATLLDERPPSGAS